MFYDYDDFYDDSEYEDFDDEDWDDEYDDDYDPENDGVSLSDMFDGYEDEEFEV